MGEGDAGRLDRLQVDRREQRGAAGVAAVARRIGEDIVKRPEPLALAARSASAGAGASQRSRMVGNAALTSNTPSSRTATTDGPSTSGRQTRAAERAG